MALGQGTGLGLASVYGTVRQSGGHIWVYSEPGHGTTFKIYLPRTESPLPEKPVAVAQPAPRSGDELILVAEDEEHVRELVVWALERRGYRVLAVGTGEEALEIIERQGDEIGVLLTDVVMPGIDGRTLLDRARARRPSLRAIFMSGYTANAMDRQPLPEDVTFLEKPFTVARLDDAIRETLAD
jgi:two-component system cell cycle sensor histidine kinase/response regulator CckA